jgi:hypothetical protein
MNDSIAEVVSECGEALAELTFEKQIEAIQLSLKLATSIAAEQNSPATAAGDFWTMVFELLKILLPLIIELIKSGG